MPTTRSSTKKRFFHDPIVETQPPVSENETIVSAVPEPVDEELQMKYNKIKRSKVEPQESDTQESVHEIENTLNTQESAHGDYHEDIHKDIHEDDHEDGQDPVEEDSLFVPDELVTAEFLLHQPSSPHATENGEEERLSQIGYDFFKGQIMQIIGEVPEKVIKHLHVKYFNRPNYIQLASDEYFSSIDSGETVELQNSQNGQRSSQNGQRSSQNGPQGSSNGSSQKGTQNSGSKNGTYEDRMQGITREMQICSNRLRQEKENSSWKRYIGTLDVQAWATRPYLKTLKFQQRLDIKRLLPNKIKKSSIVASKFGDSAVIRLYTQDEAREIGRLPEDITRILSPLIDLDLASFEAVVLMDTSRRLSIGDPFFLQIYCYLNNNTFAEQLLFAGEDMDERGVLKKKKAQPSNFSFSSETENEAALRLKQKTISRLFEKVSIFPSLSKEPEVLDDSDTSQSNTPKPEASGPTEELNIDQLKEFYTSNQQSDLLDNLPETTEPPKENFRLSLRSYQKQGLAWMLSREKEGELLETLSASEDSPFSTQRRRAINEQDEGMMHPLWRVFQWPLDPRGSSLQDGNAPQQDHFYANLYNGELSLEKPLMRNFLKGGILADEMGLGKTISTLALINSVPYDTKNTTISSKKYASKSTLIILPMSLLSQWKSEFERANNNSNHKCIIYYGESVQADLSLTLCNRENNIPIVVLTTYGTVQNEWARINKSRDEHGKLPSIGLYSVDFFRIVLDEGHTIRNRATKTARSVYELNSDRRWVLTGTPVVNRLDDIFSQVKFLKVQPWDQFSYWKTFVTLPFEQKKFHQTLDVVKSILQPIFLRRTKAMKQKDGTPLVQLPEKEVQIEELEFSDREQLFYNYFKSKAFQSYKEGMKSGDLLKKYTQILTHILRLRQVCCHPDLVASSGEFDDAWQEELAEYEKPIIEERFASETAMKEKMYSLYKRVDIAGSECSICTQAPITIGEFTLTECGHNFCLHCVMEHINFQKSNGSLPLCPDCRHPISKHRLFKARAKDTSAKEVRFHTNDTNEPDYNFQLYYYNPEKTSSKINALISHLRELRDQCPGEQVVVFSQFSAYLDIIESEIKNLGTDEAEDFLLYKFDGRLNVAEREKVLRKFTKESGANGKITILLLSLKAGGVGLNLTCARRAYMMDPWWSPSIEDQAIDRVHRIGQEKNVKVVRFIIKNSIETKMLRIQERKRMMGEAVEVEEEERRKQRIDEIKLLFDD